jgi:hypothetical protein
VIDTPILSYANDVIGATLVASAIPAAKRNFFISLRSATEVGYGEVERAA